MQRCCATARSTLSQAALEASSDALRDCVRIWTSVLDIVAATVTSNRFTDKKTTSVLNKPDAPIMPGSDTDVDVVGSDTDPDIDLVGASDASSTSKDAGKAIVTEMEMVDVSHTPRLYPGSMVVVLAEALLQAVMQAVRTKKGPDFNLGCVCGLCMWMCVCATNTNGMSLFGHEPFLCICDTPPTSALDPLESLASWMQRCWRRFVHVILDLVYMCSQAREEMCPSSGMSIVLFNTLFVCFFLGFFFPFFFICRLFPRVTDSALPRVLGSVLRRVRALSGRPEDTETSIPLLLWTELVRGLRLLFLE